MQRHENKSTRANVHHESWAKEKSDMVPHEYKTSKTAQTSQVECGEACAGGHAKKATFMNGVKSLESQRAFPRGSVKEEIAAREL